MYRRVASGLVFVAILIAFCVHSIWPPEKKIKRGLDLEGGTLLQYRLDLKSVPVTDAGSLADEV